MSADVKSIKTKYLTSFFKNDMTNTEDFDSHLQEIGKNRTKTLVFITLHTSQ